MGISNMADVNDSELLKECEDQFARLQLLQNEITLTEPDSCENPQEQSVNTLTAVAAELKEWQKTEPKLLPKDPEVLLAVGQEELQKLNADLAVALSCSQAKRDKLRETLKCEQTWLEEKKEVLTAASDHVDRLKLENQQLSEQSVLQDTKEKIRVMKGYQERLLETLGDVLEDHFPLPKNHAPLPKNHAQPSKNKNVTSELDDGRISLNEILELMMNKILETPHDPYVAIDDRFWPPYTEMLLRYNIAVRHPEDRNKIRLEN